MKIYTKKTVYAGMRSYLLEFHLYPDIEGDWIWEIRIKIGNKGYLFGNINFDNQIPF